MSEGPRPDVGSSRADANWTGDLAIRLAVKCASSPGCAGHISRLVAWCVNRTGVLITRQLAEQERNLGRADN